MRALIVLVGFAAALAAQAPPPPLFVEVDGLPAKVWVQQPLELVVRIGYDAAWFTASSVPLFQQRLDQPFHVVVPWLAAAEDRAVEVVVPPQGATGQRVAVGDRVAVLTKAGQRQQAGRSYELLELRCRWLPLAPGASLVAPVQVRYAFATRFEEDFLRGRQAIDRQETTVPSAPATLPVQALPLPAPPGFGGAVGEFTVAASCASATVRVGEAFAVVVEITGTGNLERFAPLAAPSLPGFHVQGVVERRLPTARRFELDVLPLRPGLAALPAIPFVAFSPQRGSYATQHTTPVPLQVSPAAADLPPRVRELVDADARAVAAAQAPSLWWAVFAAVLAGVLTVWRRAHRRRAGRKAAIVRAREAFLAVPVGAAAERAAAFEALLATVAGQPAWTGEVFQQLLASGHGPTALAPVRELHAALDAARFGGAAPPSSSAAAVLAAWPAMADRT